MYKEGEHKPIYLVDEVYKMLRERIEGMGGEFFHDLTHDKKDHYTHWFYIDEWLGVTVSVYLDFSDAHTISVSGISNTIESRTVHSDDFPVEEGDNMFSQWQVDRLMAFLDIMNGIKAHKDTFFEIAKANDAFLADGYL